LSANTDAKHFYDNFIDKLENDFKIGNRRMISAIEFMKIQINSFASKAVLDIGCGIGWSSHVLAAQREVDRVHAIDLSDKLIQKAQQVFPSRKIRYETVDVLGLADHAMGTFDAIVMLDVYEHIPLAGRPGFHRALRDLLSPGGQLLLTCPTISHQHYLRIHNPAGLQPVDEDVGLPQLLQLGADTGTQLDYYHVVSIWSDRDYFHAALRKPKAACRTAVRKRSFAASWSARFRMRMRSR
jgi:SAM-dependent methyltransferase